jgi:hypothetical protein
MENVPSNSNGMEKVRATGGEAERAVVVGEGAMTHALCLRNLSYEGIYLLQTTVKCPRRTTANPARHAKVGLFPI